jgi:hypothetical protein
MNQTIMGQIAPGDAGGRLDCRSRIERFEYVRSAPLSAFRAAAVVDNRQPATAATAAQVITVIRTSSGKGNESNVMTSTVPNDRGVERKIE